MKILKEGILHALRLDFAAQAARDIESRHKSNASDIAVRYSRGNVGIQDGRFLTENELDREISQL